MPQPEPAEGGLAVSVWARPEMRRLAAATFLGFSSFFLTLASLPLWAVSNGASEGVAGLVITTLLASTVLSQLIIPTAVVRFGDRRVFLAGLILIGGPAPAYAWADSLESLCFISVFRGVGFGALTVLGSTFSARIGPSSRKGEAVGAYGLAVAIANLLAVPLGAGLAVADRFVWVAMGAALPLFALPLVPKMIAGLSPPNRVVDTSARFRRAARALAAPSVILLVVTLVAGGLAASLPLERPDGLLVPLAFIAFGVTGALGRWRVGALADRLGAGALLPVSIACAALGIATLGVSLGLEASVGATAGVVLGAALLGAGYGAVQNLTMLVAFERTGNDNLASAVWNVAFDSGIAVGAFAVGAVAAGGLGLPATYLACGAFILLGFPLARVARGSRGDQEPVSPRPRATELPG